MSCLSNLQTKRSLRFWVLSTTLTPTTLIFATLISPKHLPLCNPLRYLFTRYLIILIFNHFVSTQMLWPQASSQFHQFQSSNNETPSTTGTSSTKGNGSFEHCYDCMNQQVCNGYTPLNQEADPPTSNNEVSYCTACNVFSLAFLCCEESCLFGSDVYRSILSVKLGSYDRTFNLV